MANPFDQFDAAPTKASVNPFDQFDAPKTAVATPAAAPAKPLSLGEVATSAVENIPSSALGVAESAVTPIIHPIKTAEGLYKTATGEVEKLLPGKYENEKYANAVNQYFTDRYGSVEGFKKAIATDPVGVMTDLSIALTGGGSLAAKLPGIAGKAGEVAATAGRATNPIAPITKAVGAAIKPAAKVASGIIGTAGTHTGAKPLQVAAEAGSKGGQAAQVFLDNLRGNVPTKDVVDSAETAVKQLRDERGQAYRGGMAGVITDPTVLNFNDIDAAIAKADQIKTFKGVSLEPHTEAIRDQIKKAIGDWKAKNPADFHTVEGMDALKQSLRYMVDAQPYDSPARKVAQDIYGAVRQTIVNQAPQYAKIMKDYEQATDLIDEMKSTFSLKPNASVDTQLRKLQSIMRNNVQTNFGRRAELGAKLAQKQPTLEAALAGQSLNAPYPRGLGGYEMAGDILAGFANPKFWAALPFMSPRLMGETAYYGGKAYGGVARVGPYVPNTLTGLYATEQLAPYDPLSGQ